MSNLSLAMIVRDEAAALGHCLQSVRSLVDELVVVDTGSEDGTVAVAQSFGARIGRFPWRDDFAAARNESLRLCTGDWVLLLDADEAVDPLDHPELRRAVDQGAAAAFHLVSRNYTRDGSARLFDQPATPNRSRYSEGADLPFYFDQPILRLVRRLPDLQFEGRIHERLDDCLQRKHLPVGSLGAVIHHFGKLDQGREKAKAAYYLRLAEQEAQEHPRDPNRQFNLMAQAEVAGSWETALRAGLAFLRHSRTVPSTVRLTLALAYQQTARPEAAQVHLRQILKAQPEHLLALCRMAGCLEALGHLDEARSSLARATAAHPDDPWPCLVLAGLEERAGRPPAARQALMAAVTCRPGDPRLRQDLLDLDFRLHLPVQAAADAMDALRALPDQGGGDWHALAALALLKEGHVRPGRAVLALGLETFPGHPGLARLAGELPREEPAVPPLSKQTAADTGSGAGSGARKTCG